MDTDDLRSLTPTGPTSSWEGSKSDRRLYSIRGIDIATFFGSLVAGGYLLSRNFRQLGDSEAARNSILLGLLGITAVFTAAFQLPDMDARQARLVRFVFQAVQVGAVHLAARRFQGAALAEHEASGGTFFSGWRAAGVGLLFALGIMAALVAFVFLIPEQ